MKRILRFIAPLALLAIAACGGEKSSPGEFPDSLESGNEAPPERIMASGTVLVDNGFHVTSPELDSKGCPPDPSMEGQQVVFKDGNGQTVGLTKLGDSKKVHASNPPALDPVNPDYGYPIFCGYDFTADVIATSAFYTISVGGAADVTLSREDLEKAITLTVN